MSDKKQRPYEALWLCAKSNNAGRIAYQLKSMISKWIDMGMPALSRIDVCTVDELKLKQSLATAKEALEMIAEPMPGSPPFYAAEVRRKFAVSALEKLK